MEPNEHEIVELEETTEEVTEPVESKEPEETTDYKAEAAKWKAIAERNKKKAQKLPTKEEDPELRNKVQNLEQVNAKRDFGYRHGLSPEETDAVYRLNPNPTEETLKDPFVSGGLERIRASKRVENNTPSPSGAKFTVGGKSWDEMNRDEKNANYEEYHHQLQSQRKR